ncbi:MAG TPA: winged helix DNA-binding domain-containing protein [Chloroflexota bacterium]|nr:winged helix DNA-binding domain-containing protein [Chloroflexota bacterium]
MVKQLCGVHAQVQPSAELALAIRIDELTQADLRAELWQRRSLVRTYGPRGTVHLLAADDLPIWLSALRAKTPPRPPNRQELEALPPERMPDLLAAMRDALNGACLTRSELATRVELSVGAWATEEAFPAFGGFMPRWQLALSTAANEGVLVFGPPRGAQVTYVRLDQWLDKLPEVDGQQALREVFKRYLETYGPASHVDFARWFTTHPTAAREVQSSLDDELEEVSVEGTPLWQLEGTTYRHATSDGVHLVPQFDSYVVGCHPREQLIPTLAAEPLGRRDTAAQFNVLLVGGVVGGLWQRKLRGKQLDLRVDAFVQLSSSQRAQVAQCAERMAEFLGRTAHVSFVSVARRGHL